MLKYFGTDGIRGVVNEKIDFNLAYNVGKSLATYIKKHKLSKNIVIGKDTRVSGDMLTSAIACGLCDYGVNVKDIGIVSTGCVSYLSNKLDVGAGVMITASHNVPCMNGIKIINNLGYKFTIAEEQEIEKYIDLNIVPTKTKGRIVNSEFLVEKYIKYLVSEVGTDLTGLNIALDTAYGSNYKIAEDVFKMLNANIIAINNSPLGEKINVNCGALNVSKLKTEVMLHNCDFGFAFDGDADRLIVVLNNGKVLSGDDLIFILASYLHSKNKLNSLKVVGTIMTNSGMEQSLNKLGISLIRTDVGDRNVIEMMQKNNYSLGGESSGHICISSLNTTCDALINALYLLKIVITENLDLSEKLLHLKKVNQTIKNIEVSQDFRKQFDQNIEFRNKLAKLEKQNPNERIVVRPSGTENVIRIMVEGNEIKCLNLISQIENIINNDY